MKRLIIVFWIVVFFTFLYLPKIRLFNHEEKVISIFTWPDFYDPKVIKKFEQKTGYKIHLSFFSSNEELIIKVKNGGSNYDLITPSDYAVTLLKEQDLLRPLDKERISSTDHFYPFLLKQEYDPHNKYSIPIMWEVYGIGYHQDLVPSEKEIGYNLLFENQNHKIAMVPDPIEAICFAGFHLYKDLNNLQKQDLIPITKLLKNQKQWVEAYVDDRAKYLLSTENCDLALLRSGYYFQIASAYPHIAFTLPKEGFFISVENFAIPKNGKHVDMVYEFINFMMQPENTAANLGRVPLYPADPDVLALIDVPLSYYHVLQEIEDHPKKVFFKHLFPEQDIRDAWVEIKSYQISK